MSPTHDAGLLLLAGAAVVGLIVLVTWCRFPAFIALMIASLLVGLGAGRNPSEIVKSFSEGVGSVLGSVAMILGLGAILGKALAASGGAAQLGSFLIDEFPKRWTACAIACAAFVIGIPVFFSAGLVLLIPVIVTAAGQRGIPLVRFGLPMVAGLSVAHGLIPPHPGPISAVEILHADLGKTILYSLLVGFPMALITGAVIAPVLAARLAIGSVEIPVADKDIVPNEPGRGLTVALLTILMPVILMLSGAIADFSLPSSSPLRLAADCLGTPIIAMLIGALFSLWSLARHHGFNKHQMARLSEEALPPIAAVLLVVGGGGGFSRVLIDSGVGAAVARQATSLNIPPLLLAWLIAAFIRIATGSATVAITTGAGLLAPITAANPALNRELVVLALGAGSLILSHVNDGGFWLVKEYLNLTVTQTLRTWTILETAISLLAFVLVLLLSLII
jgi:GntP family gluconate:H+ symporter